MKNYTILPIFLVLPYSNVWAYTDEALSCYQAVAASSYKDAATHCNEAAMMGDSEAKFKLATLYAQGRGVAQNMHTSISWLQSAADQGHPEAQYNLGFAYQYGNGVSSDAELAVKWYRVSAESGFAKAQRNLAYMFEMGIGVDASFDNAYLWIQKSARQGLDSSQLKFGLMLLEKGSKFDELNAIAWIRQSAERGNADAQFALGSILKAKDSGESVSWYEKAINQNHAYAMHNLAVYLSQDGSQRQDLERAATLADRAVKAGHGESVSLKYAIDRSINAAQLQPTNAHWLMLMAPDHYTIQLVLSSSLERIQLFISEHHLQDSARHYATLREGEPIYIVILGDYADHAEATQARSALPENLRKTKPFIQKIKNLQDNHQPPDVES